MVMGFPSYGDLVTRHREASIKRPQFGEIFGIEPAVWDLFALPYELPLESRQYRSAPGLDDS